MSSTASALAPPATRVDHRAGLVSSTATVTATISAARLIHAASPTDVPPNFITRIVSFVI